MSGKKEGATLWEYLEEVPDHREEQGKRYKLRSVLALTIGATLAGRQGLEAVRRWGKGLEGDEELLLAFGIDRRTTPCKSALHYVFKDLAVEELERALGAWVMAVGGDGATGQVSIDGKVLRGSRSGAYPGLGLIAAYCEAAGGVVAEMRVRDGMNEVTAALKLLKEVPLEGAVVTGDAIYAQKRLCREVMKRGGDYLIAVKDNQPELKSDIEAAFAEPVSPLRSRKASA